MNNNWGLAFLIGIAIFLCVVLVLFILWMIVYYGGLMVFLVLIVGFLVSMFTIAAKDYLDYFD